MGERNREMIGKNKRDAGRTNKRRHEPTSGWGPKICTITQGPSSFEYTEGNKKKKTAFNYHYLFFFFETMLKQALSPTQGTKWRTLRGKGKETAGNT